MFDLVLEIIFISDLFPFLFPFNLVYIIAIMLSKLYVGP